MYNLNSETAEVLSIIEKREDIEIVKLNLGEDKEGKGINYPYLTGSLKKGNKVLINTTAVDLGLGTGGYHFVISKRENKRSIGCKDKNKINKNREKEAGHIMKLRYTPFQMRTLSVEEEASPYHNSIKNFTSLAGDSIIFIPLHSLLAPLIISFKSIFPKRKIAYIMSEGGSLALPFSNSVHELKKRGLLDKTITVGQAFGGDFEAVNIFTALACAKEVIKADLIIVGMGPGLVGTNTKFGFSGTENSLYSYAVSVLEGRSIIVPRVTFAEKRNRHYIISHHTLTLLNRLIKHQTDVVFPDDPMVKKYAVQKGLEELHNLYYYKIDQIEEILKESQYNFLSMGRKFKEDPLFFITAGLAVLRYDELNKG